MIISNTSNVPLGILGPILMIGSFFGRLYGHLLFIFFGIKDEFLYSMVGAACFLSASIHSIAPPILIFELTGQSSYLIHLLFSSLIANLIGQSLTVNAFDLILFIRKLPHLPSVKSSKLYTLTAKDIKEKISSYLRLITPTDNKIQELNRISHINPIGNTNNITPQHTPSYYFAKSNVNTISLNDPDLMSTFNPKFHFTNINSNQPFMQPSTITQDENFDRNSLHYQESEDEIRIYNEFNIISALILLYKLDKFSYASSIPVVDSENYIQFTFTAKKLYLYLKHEYEKNKSKFDVRIHSSMNELLDFIRNKFIPPKRYFIMKMFLKFKKFFRNMAESHKHRLDKYFLESSMYEILRRLKEYAALNKESFLNWPIDQHSPILDLDSSFLTIEQNYSALKIQFLFTFLSMSHLFVTEKGKLVGIITKEEFIKKSMVIK